MYNVFLNVKGDETLVFRGYFKEVNQYEDSLRDRIRAMDPEGNIYSCVVVSDERLEKRIAAIEKWESLTEEEKKEEVTVSGWTYIKSIYDAMHLIKSR
jgi:hypothetical protein